MNDDVLPRLILVVFKGETETIGIPIKRSNLHFTYQDMIEKIPISSIKQYFVDNISKKTIRLNMVREMILQIQPNEGFFALQSITLSDSPNLVGLDEILRGRGWEKYVTMINGKMMMVLTQVLTLIDEDIQHKNNINT